MMNAKKLAWSKELESEYDEQTKPVLKTRFSKTDHELTKADARKGVAWYERHKGKLYVISQ
jgi:hypothetical protein